MKKKVLFVCSSNVCRSAVAAAILIEYGRDRYDVSSAGIRAPLGEPMCEECADALGMLFGHGYSAYNHTSNKLTRNHIADADLVVCVTADFAAELREKYREYADKIVSFPKSVAGIAYLRGWSMQRAVEGIRDQVFEMFLNDRNGN